MNAGLTLPGRRRPRAGVPRAGGRPPSSEPLRFSGPICSPARPSAGLRFTTRCGGAVFRHDVAGGRVRRAWRCIAAFASPTSWRISGGGRSRASKRRGTSSSACRCCCRRSPIRASIRAITASRRTGRKTTRISAVRQLAPLMIIVFGIQSTLLLPIALVVRFLILAPVGLLWPPLPRLARGPRFVVCDESGVSPRGEPPRWRARCGAGKSRCSRAGARLSR